MSRKKCFSNRKKAHYVPGWGKDDTNGHILVKRINFKYKDPLMHIGKNIKSSVGREIQFSLRFLHNKLQPGNELYKAFNFSQKE